MEQFIAEIMAYCAAKGISPGTFGSYAAGDGKFMRRLNDGGQCTPRTMDRVRAYMADNPPSLKIRGDAA